MAEIQAEGLRAAGEVLERVLGSEPVAGAAGGPRADYSALVEAWAELLRRGVAVLTLPGTPGAVTAAIDAHRPGPVVRLTAPGQAEIWLHNGTGVAVGAVALSCGVLVDADGNTLPAAAVTFDPSEVDALPPRSSRAVVVAVASGAPRPGCYRGVIQARGAPAVWLPFEVTVE